MKKTTYLFLVIAFAFTTEISFAQTQITFYTSMGNFVAEMYDTLQPITAGNFIQLVEKKFYDGIIFHRVVKNFVIQGGDPTGSGSGGPGYTIPDEFNAKASNVTGAFGMANSGPNTAGSQFYINLKNNLNLNPNYPVFGIVISNIEIVQQIGLVPVNAQDRPLTPVVMDSVRITKAGPLGINEQYAESKNISISPNPASDYITLTIPPLEKRGLGGVLEEIQIFDIFGKSALIVGAIYELPLQIDISTLPTGVYFVMIGDKVEKFVKI
ncbi:MAG: hypothetical protein A2X64_06955 [Ignavibacteria bacterium GWF2_33_9]|nr:MAG: hypothetical protein A2X64_06955 [Ignavibacteria bacterium GWF2_33_9]